jgi:DNA-binding MurR/RpiR family transcriptional regulator
MMYLTRIQNMKSKLTQTEVSIANFIEANIDSARSMTSSEMAKAIGVSQSAIVKFCKKINYSGFSEFKIAITEAALTKKNSDFIHDQIQVNDTPASIMSKIAHESKKAIDATMEINSAQTLDIISKALFKARRIVLLGIGASALVASDFYHKLLKLDCVVIFDPSSHVQLSSVVPLTPDDLVFAISFSGESKEILLAAEHAKQSGVTLISLTKYTRNSLSSISDYNLYASAQESLFRASAVSSRIAQLTVIDALFMMMLLLDPEKSRSMIEENTRIVSELKLNI